MSHCCNFNIIYNMYNSHFNEAGVAKQRAAAKCLSVWRIRAFLFVIYLSFSVSPCSLLLPISTHVHYYSAPCNKHPRTRNA